VSARPASTGAGNPPTGGCLCAAVEFEVRTPITVSHNCHCSRCRRARSAAHASNGFTSAQGLVFTRGTGGEGPLRTFRLPGARLFGQTFCVRCGAKLPRIDAGLGRAQIPLGSLDDHPDLTPQDYTYVGSKAPWFEITDALPRFEERPPAP